MVVRRGASMGRLTEVVPITHLNLNPIVFSSLFDIGKSQVTVSIRNVLYLIESRQRIPDMRGIC